MAVNYRKPRLAAGVRDEVALIVSREIRDPRLGFVTVVRAELASDGSVAKIFVSPLGDAVVRGESMRALKSAQGYVRKLVGQRMRLRSAPEIHFVEDHGLEATERVSAIIDRLRDAEAATAAPDPAPDPETR